jgi:hypothetical protein
MLPFRWGCYLKRFLCRLGPYAIDELLEQLTDAGERPKSLAAMIETAQARIYITASALVCFRGPGPDLGPGLFQAANHPRSPPRMAGFFALSAFRSLGVRVSLVQSLPAGSTDSARRAAPVGDASPHVSPAGASVRPVERRRPADPGAGFLRASAVSCRRRGAGSRSTYPPPSKRSPPELGLPRATEAAAQFASHAQRR